MNKRQKIFEKYAKMTSKHNYQQKEFESMNQEDIDMKSGIKYTPIN